MNCIADLCEHYSIEKDDESTFPMLKKALQDDRISIDDEDRISIIMKAGIKTVKGTTDALHFRRITGRERKVMMNAPDDKRGDAIYQCIAHMSGATQKALEDLPSQEAQLLEEVFSYFF